MKKIEKPAGVLTENEKLMICDVLRPSFQIISESKSILADMVGDRRDTIRGQIFRRKDRRIIHRVKLTSGLEHEILDACNLDRLDGKRGVDGVELLFKIRGMIPERRRTLILTVAALLAKGSRSNQGEVDSIDC